MTSQKLWAHGSLYSKLAGVFTSTGTLGGGQETTIANFMSTLTHHGMIYVPLGYAKTFKQFGGLATVRGGSAWGAGTLAGGDGSRQPSELELEVARLQGKGFSEFAQRVRARENKL